MAGSLAGKRILVVEDEYFIASDLARAFKAEGAIVVGPVGDLARGLRLAEESLDAAVLDVNLEGAKSFEIADTLARRNIPYMFLTGYDDWALPASMQEIPRLAKPFTTRVLLTKIGNLIQGGEQ